MNELLYYITERENIRLNGSTDKVLTECRFSNIDRRDDRRTKYLFSFIKDFTLFERVFYIQLFRLCYSNPRILEQMSGIFMHDFRNILYDIVKLKIGKISHNKVFVSKPKLKQVALISIWDRSLDICKLFESNDEVSLITMTNVISNLYGKNGGLRYIALASEVSKDLSFFYRNHSAIISINLIKKSFFLK